MKTLNQISQEKYSKNYNHLPDDGAEQDFVQGIFSNQTKTDKATARPWRTAAEFSPYRPAPTIYGGQQQVAVCRDANCVCFTEQDVENAKLIVRAVNEHDALVAVAEAAYICDLDNKLEACGDAVEPRNEIVHRQRLSQALANLAAVRGESEGGK